jgi:hypothetical protein
MIFQYLMLWLYYPVGHYLLFWGEKQVRIRVKVRVRVKSKEVLMKLDANLSFNEMRCLNHNSNSIPNLTLNSNPQT